MNNYILVQFLVVCITYARTETRKTEDYCWRDYEGTIPSDALLATRPNQNENPVYIGQVLFKDKLITGKIYKNDKKIYFEYFDVEYSTESNVKILCSKQPQKFEWIATRNTDVLKLPTNLLIKGGFEPNCSAYIGRVEISGQMNPGKVMCCNGVEHCYGLYTTNNGKGTLQTTFDVLKYNENVPSVGIDVRIKENEKDNNTSGRCKQITINLFN